MPLQSKTWTTLTVLDAPDMNTYVRDNVDFLKNLVPQAKGTQSFTLVSGGGANPSAVGGTTSFGVTFAAAPIVIATVLIGGNIDVLFNLVSTPTTTQFSWRVFTAKDTSSSTAGGSFHWIAIGALA